MDLSGLGVKLPPAHLSTTHGEGQARKLRVSIIINFGLRRLTRPRIESGFTVSAADAPSTRIKTLKFEVTQ